MAADTAMPTPKGPTPKGPPPQWQARQLLRAARVGTLATSADGQPFAALVTPATAPDLSPVLWLSSLSEHTRHLAAEPRCALLVAGPAADENPQTAPRLTVTGLAERIENSYLKSRWLALHPYAAPYADFADFSLWRIRPMGGHFVGGFARATRLRPADLAPDPVAVAAVETAAPDILAHCNQDHPNTMETLACTAGGAPGPWRMVAVDLDGCDLALGQGTGQKTLRISFAAPVTGPEEVRRELIRLAHAAQ